LRRSKKRRVQRLRNQELKQAGIKKKQVWRPKDKPDGSGRSAPTCMVCFLPNEFMLQLIRLCRKRYRQTLMRLSNLG
jgi:hypothetical protein